MTQKLLNWRNMRPISKKHRMPLLTHLSCVLGVSAETTIKSDVDFHSATNKDDCHIHPLSLAYKTIITGSKWVLGKIEIWFAMVTRENSIMKLVQCETNCSESTEVIWGKRKICTQNLRDIWDFRELCHIGCDSRTDSAQNNENDVPYSVSRKAYRYFAVLNTN